MTLMLFLNSKVEYLVGGNLAALNPAPLVPFDDLACGFLGDLSSILMNSPETRTLPDVMAFAFWCRKGNIAKLKSQFGQHRYRLGLGVTFHIAPSNVPVNFAFSFAFSLLAGNANIVRVPSEAFPQTDVICRAINTLLADESYKQIAEMTAFVRYKRDDAITGAFSSGCDARIIWGGDATIAHVRRLPIPVRCVEIAFSDRYSLCVIDSSAVRKIDDNAVCRLAEDFFNDVYLMDQNACSSPHLVVWLGKDNDARCRFWQAVHAVVEKRYELSAAHAIDKFTLACENAIDVECIAEIERYGNFIYLARLRELPGDCDELRGKYGFMYEYTTDNLNSTAHIVNGKYQTLTYYGPIQSQLVDYVVGNRLTGIDRIVPVGKALDIDVVWDGYDIIQTLSRIIDVR